MWDRLVSWLQWLGLVELIEELEPTEPAPAPSHDAVQVRIVAKRETP